MTNRISWKEILKQLKADLIGKDSYRGVTLTYAWLANQFGHISLGFIPTFILYIILSKHNGSPGIAFKSAIIVSIGWLVFEAYNFLGPLLLKKRSTSKVLFVPGPKYIFQPSWGNIAFDTITDLFFFWIGAFAASLLCSYSPKALLALIVLSSLVLYPSYYWFVTKIYLQTPQYPFQFRLSQWDVQEISKPDISTVHRFLKNKGKGLHLFVFGSRRSGKTSLGVAIGTELSIKHTTCTYTTAMKLYSMFFESDKRLMDIRENLWTWRTSSLVIVDDINPGHPIKDDIVSPYLFLQFLDTYYTNEINRKAIRNTNIIWVFGNTKSKNESVNEWVEMLTGIGIDKEKILSIHLPDNYLS